MSADAHAGAKPHLPRLPLAIPDLRFESTYLRNIRPFVHLPADPHAHAQLGEDVAELPAGKEQRVKIDWGSVVWVTVRDMVVSPLMWGALTGLSRPLLVMIQAKVDFWKAKHAFRSGAEGGGVSWLREWFAGLTGSGRGGLNGSVGTANGLWR